jgi:hypothetical protein
MPFPADFETLAETRLFMKAGRPTDNTEAAFETFFGADALEFTVTQVGAIEGREFNTSELDVVSAAQIRRKKGNYSLPQSEWAIVGDDGDEAYEAARVAMQSYDIVSFAAVRQSGAVLYWTAQVMNLTDSGGGSNDALTYAMTLLFQTEAIKAVTPVVPTV